jgi:myo-inositol-1(or 4)-monophosphatase
MDLSALCDKVADLARTTGGFIRHEGKSFDLSRIEYKGFNDLVSYVDKQSEVQLVAGLKELLPEAGFITEEGTVKPSEADYTWIIDPLDGTTNFLHGVPCYSVSIGLHHREEVVLGVVYEINLDECFYAWKGGGAFLNGSQIQVTTAPTLRDSLIATGYPYSSMEMTELYLKILGSYMGKTHGVRRLGSAAADLAYVAAGRFEGFFEFNLNPYDVAAGVILVQEAGGKVTNFRGGGDPVFGREIVASNGHVHDEMVGVIAEFWPARS